MTGAWLSSPTIALPVVLALAVDPAGYAPFGPIKHVALAVLTLGAGASLIVSRRQWRSDRWPLLVWAGLLCWLSLAATVGVDRFHGWFGLPERRLGVVTWILFAACFVIAQSLPGRQRRALVLGCVVAGVGVGMWSVLEGFGVAPIEVAGSSVRLGGPFGSAAYLGAAACLFAPLCFGAALDRATHRGWRIAGWVGAVGCAIGLVGSGTRGAWVGIFCGIAVCLAGRWRAIVGDRRLGTSCVVALVCSIAVGGWLLPETERPTAAAQRVGASGRLDEWSLAVSVLRDRPIVGAGPEGYRIVAGAHVSANYERAYGRVVMPDRAHNALLDLGVSGGVPALLCYGALLVLVGRRVWAVLRSGPPLIVGASVGLISYGVQQQFLFPLAEVDPIAWLVAGVVAAAAAPGRPVTWQPSRWMAVVPAAVGTFAVAVGIQGVRSDREVQSAVEALNRGDVEGARQHAAEAVQLRPDVLRNRIALGRTEAAAGTIAGLDAAIDTLDGALDWSPRDPVVARERATVLSTKAQATGAADDQQIALDAWIELAVNDPDNAAVLLELGVAQAVAGDVTAAAESWSRAADLAPRSTTPLINMARLAANEGRIADARLALDEASRRSPGDPAVQSARDALGLGE